MFFYTFVRVHLFIYDCLGSFFAVCLFVFRVFVFFIVCPLVFKIYLFTDYCLLFAVYLFKLFVYFLIVWGVCSLFDCFIVLFILFQQLICYKQVFYNIYDLFNSKNIEELTHIFRYFTSFIPPVTEQKLFGKLLWTTECESSTSLEIYTG